MKYLFSAVFILFFVVPSPEKIAFAAEEEPVFSSKDILDEVSLVDFESFFNEIKEKYNLDVSETIRQLTESVLQGESELTVEYFTDLMSSLFSAYLKQYLLQAAIILSVCIFLSVFKNISAGLTVDSCEKTVFLACYGVVLALVLNMSAETLKMCSDLMEIVTKFVSVAFPPLFGVMTALGATSSVGLYQPTLAFFSGVLVTCLKNAVYPLFYVSLTVSLVGGISDEFSLKKMSEATRSAAEWLLGIVFGTFITFSTAQGIAGSGFDAWLTEGTKSALSGTIPIIGNYVKDGFDIVFRSCVVVKNALGLCSIAILLFVFSVPFIRIVILSVVLKLTAAVAEPIGANGISDMLCTVSKCFRVPIAALFCTFFSLTVILMLIIASCNSGVV